MKQITVKRAVEAWYWIANNSHHICGVEEHPTKRDKNGRFVRTAMYLQNHHEKLRIPDALCAEVWSQIRANKRLFDTRMFTLKKRAAEMVRK